MVLDNKKNFRIVGISTAILCITTPILAILLFRYDVINAFMNPSYEDSTYWIMGVIGIWIIFGLIAVYMSFSTLKDNINNRSKFLGLFFLPLLLTANVGGVVYLLIENVPQQRGPYLSWMGDPKTTMTLTFEIKSSGSFDVEYKKESDSLWNNEPISFTISDKRSSDGYYHYTANLTNLNPNTRYEYKIAGINNDIMTFNTAPDNKNTPFKILVYGDSREYSKTIDNEHIPLMKQFIEEQNEEDFAFAINNGDTATSHNDIASWNLHFLAIDDVASRMPYFVASGNHEWNMDALWWSTENQPAIDIQDFPIGDDSINDIYSLNETSYAFGYSCAYFIFLGAPHAGCNKTAYLDWLEYQLKIANGTIGDGYEFIFIYDHYPPFDRRENAYNDDVMMIKTEVPMYYYSGVDAVISGHNHVLAIQNITWSGDPAYPNSRNMTCLITGAGGASTRVPKYGLWENNYTMGFYGKTTY
ncbi:MAG: hypothetical protein GF364_06895, partial [Candidatus Lokiarchaeota archaeon]|nr:hypothetical protein [Candidatus Lokiarchaeota archaeon]